MTRIKRDSIAYLLIVGFCIWLLTWAIPTYTPPYPGYGASPALVLNVSVSVMIFMAVLSLLRIIVSIYTHKPVCTEEREFPEDLKNGGGFTQVGRVNLPHLARIMVPCVLLVVIIDYIGYELSSLAFLMALQYLIGSRRWLQMVIVSVALTAALYIIMRYGFGVPIPGLDLFELFE